jgi:hypothetical protein
VDGGAGGAGVAGAAGSGPIIITSGSCPTIDGEVQKGTAAPGFATLWTPAAGQFQVHVGDLALTTDHVYFVAAGALMRVPKAGGAAEQVHMGGSSLLLQGSDLIWTEAAADGMTLRIMKAAIASPDAATELATGLGSVPSPLLSDGTSLFFTHPEGGIGRLSLAGGEVEKLGGSVSFEDLALLGADLYGISSGVVMKVDQEGGEPTQVATLFFDGELASDGTDLFWADGSEGTIRKFAPPSTEGTLLASRTDTFTGWPSTLSAYQGVAYWSEGGHCAQVYRVAADGTGHAMIMQGFGSVYRIAVDDSGVYVSDEDGLYRMDRP